MTKTILLCMSNTGGGHRSAAKAVSDAVKEIAKRRRVEVNVVTVVMTDPNGDFWTGWACKDAELTIAPNEFVRQRLLMLGLRPDRVRVLGMPVNPEFLRPPTADRTQVLARLGLKTDLFTICLTAGWVGGGHLKEIYRQLSAVEKQCQILVICGHNERLRVEIERLSHAFPKLTVVVSSVQSMSDLMGAADLLVTKAGGLTTFEAVARRLPMAIDVMDVMPQEAATAKMLADAGLAHLVRKPSDIIDIVEKGTIRLSTGKRPLPTAYNLDLTDKSVYEIAKAILSSCEASTEEDGQNVPNQEQMSA